MSKTQPRRQVRRAQHDKSATPSVPAYVLRREALEARLDEAFGARLTTVVAEAGFGKSTLVAAWAGDVEAAWYTASVHDAGLPSVARGLAEALRARVRGLPSELTSLMDSAGGSSGDELARADAFAAALCAALDDELAHDLVLVLDDVHELGSSAGSLRLIEGLSRQLPDTVHLVLVSRTDPPFPIQRLRGRGQLVELTSTALTFSVEEVRQLLGRLVDEEAGELGRVLHEVTGGWPAAVRLAIEALRTVPPEERAQALGRLRHPDSPLFGYLAEEVLGPEDPAVQQVLRRVALFDRFNADLCGALGVEAAGETLARLTARGLFVQPHPDGGEWLTLHALVREFVREKWLTDEAERRGVQRLAAEWFEANGCFPDATRAYAAAGDWAGLARCLEDRGLRLLAAGAVETVISSVNALPPDFRTPPVEQLAGEALQIRGDWDEALARLRSASASAEGVSPGTAWRMGVMHYLRGEIDEALALYESARIDGSEPHESALLQAWHATAHWVRGDAERCRDLATSAIEAATAAADDRGLAASHTVLAMLATLEGDRAGAREHSARALNHAERAGDLLQTIRIRTNRGSHMADEGEYEAALAELDEAIRLADLAGFANFQALGLSNRGEVRLKLGRLDEALVDLEAARDFFERLQSRARSYPLGHLGDVYRERGDLALARAAYEEAIAVAEQSGDAQALVPALAGLARVLATDDASEAERVADRALSFGTGFGSVGALLAKGWLALLRDDRGAAARLAAEAAAEARSRRDRAGLAESLELQGSASEAKRRHACLEEACGIWRDLGNPLAEARADLVLAMTQGDRSAAQRATRRLAALGVRVRAAASAAGILALVPPQEQPPISIHTLGTFTVFRGGEAIPQSAWRSRKARDLLKMLLARRGQPTQRDVLIEALWPGDDPATLGNRFSVAVSTLRSVLDPDKRFEPEHFVVADRATIGLDLTNLAVDVETFLAAAASGLALRREGRAREAAEQLAEADALYAGDFLEEEIYEDWAVAVREEARAAYVEVARALAADASAAGDYDTAVRYFLRILERDRYDEPAHFGLVSALSRAGRHGEARRFYRRYVGHMEEIGVESAPFPALAA